MGGKVAVDLPQGKNLVGVHQLPWCWTDPTPLSTLTDAFWRDGMGEVLKYGCIGDTALLSLLEQAAPGGGRRWKDAPRRSSAARGAKARSSPGTARHRSAHDAELRPYLGHAVEAAQQFSGLSHGQAVAVGMRRSRVCPARGPYAARDAGAPGRAGGRFVPALPPAGNPRGAAPGASALDKKNLDGGLTVCCCGKWASAS